MSKILWLASVAEQIGLSLTWPHIPGDMGFCQIPIREIILQGRNTPLTGELLFEPQLNKNQQNDMCAQQRLR